MAIFPTLALRTVSKLSCKFIVSFILHQKSHIYISRFSGCWTTLTAGAYTILFLHPTWSKYAISSIGAQAIWILLTWFIWVTGAAILNSALPHLIAGGSCMGLVYCGQIQSLFGTTIVHICLIPVINQSFSFRDFNSFFSLGNVCIFFVGFNVADCSPQTGADSRDVDGHMACLAVDPRYLRCCLVPVRRRNRVPSR
jgi:hypothetical protein